MQALWVLLASFFFATMSVGIKIAGASFSVSELLFYRGTVSVLFMAVLMRARGVSPQTTVPSLHLWRSLVGTLSLGAWFYAITHLPLATAMTLNYMSSIWIGAFVCGGAMLYRRSGRQGPLLATVLSGFVGVVMVLRPTLDQDQLFAGVIGLLSGLSAAIAYLQVTGLGQAGEPDLRTVFYFSIGSMVAGLAGMAVTNITPWSAVPWQAAAWLVPIGILASLGQWCLTRAYSRGSTLLVANLQYTGIVLGALYGLMLFGDQIPPLGWAGMGVIMASGIAATVLRTRALGQTLAEEH